VLAGFFVLVLLLVIVLDSARSMTSTSTIRLVGLSTSRIKSQNAQFQNARARETKPDHDAGAEPLLGRIETKAVATAAISKHTPPKTTTCNRVTSG
jgi:hypothetical protein